jgi:hypothetical protein
MKCSTKRNRRGRNLISQSNMPAGKKGPNCY